MKKFAVLEKSPEDPLEVWEYIDDIEEAKKYWYVRVSLDKYGVEGTMPICMNRMGGYHQLYKPYLKCIIEAEDFPTIRTHKDLFQRHINNPKFHCGWIDTQGNTYICNYMGHARLASELVELFYEDVFKKWKMEHLYNAPDDFLIETGWIKVFDSPPYHAVLYDKATDEAIKKLDEIEIALKRGNYKAAKVINETRSNNK